MNPRSKGCLVAFAVILAAILQFGWWVLGGSAPGPRTIRSRLTLVVETPEGERTGSSVTQLTTSFPGPLGRVQGWRLVGEVVVVDLGARGLLFTTFESQRGITRGGMDRYNAALTLFPRENFRGKYQKDMSNYEEYAAYLDELNRLKPKGELPFKDLPVLVRFRDPKDPTSVELVDPLNLAASFGSGVTLTRASVEITDDPITHGIEDRLPWLASSNVSPTLIPPVQVLRTITEVPPVENLRYDDFRRLPR
jgi:hypothetical protein